MRSLLCLNRQEFSFSRRICRFPENLKLAQPWRRITLQSIVEYALRVTLIITRARRVSLALQRQLRIFVIFVIIFVILARFRGKFCDILNSRIGSLFLSFCIIFGWFEPSWVSKNLIWKLIWKFHFLIFFCIFGRLIWQRWAGYCIKNVSIRAENKTA